MNDCYVCGDGDVGGVCHLVIAFHNSSIDDRARMPARLASVRAVVAASRFTICSRIRYEVIGFVPSVLCVCELKQSWTDFSKIF